jgi:hypothetical protein
VGLCFIAFNAAYPGYMLASTRVHGIGDNYLQVIHPDEDLGLYVLLRIPFGAPIVNTQTDVVVKTIRVSELKWQHVLSSV